MAIDHLLEKLKQDTGQELEALGAEFRSDLQARIVAVRQARDLPPRRATHWWQWLPAEWSELLTRPTLGFALIALFIGAAATTTWLRHDEPLRLPGVSDESALSLTYFEPFLPDAPESRVLGYDR